MNYLLLLLCVIWGTNWVFMKLADAYFPPVMFSAIRFIVGTLVLFGLVFYKRIPFPKRTDWKWYAICGLLQTTFIFIVNQLALEYNNAGITSVLAFTMPFWFFIVAPFFIPEERITLAKMLGLLIGIAGLFFVMDINPLKMASSGMKLLSELLAVAGAIAWAVSNTIVKIKLEKHDKIQFTAYQMGIGAAGLLLYSLVFEQGQPITWNWISLSCVLFAGVVSSALGFLLWFYILAKGNASKASISVLLVPVIGVLSGYLFLGEALKWSSILGVLLVLSGIGIVNTKREKAATSLTVPLKF